MLSHVGLVIKLSLSPVILSIFRLCVISLLWPLCMVSVSANEDSTSKYGKWISELRLVVTPNPNRIGTLALAPRMSRDAFDISIPPSTHVIRPMFNPDLFSIEAFKFKKHDQTGYYVLNSVLKSYFLKYVINFDSNLYLTATFNIKVPIGSISDHNSNYNFFQSLTKNSIDIPYNFTTLTANLNYGDGMSVVSKIKNKAMKGTGFDAREELRNFQGDSDVKTFILHKPEPFILYDYLDEYGALELSYGCDTKDKNILFKRVQLVKYDAEMKETVFSDVKVSQPLHNIRINSRLNVPGLFASFAYFKQAVTKGETINVRLSIICTTADNTIQRVNKELPVLLGRHTGLGNYW